jgi:hypothetical protein
VQSVVGAVGDLARDGERGGLRAAACSYLFVERADGTVLALRGLRGGLDQCPAQLGRAVLGELAAPLCLARLGDDRVEPGGPDGLSRAAESFRFAQLGEQVAGQDRTDAVDRLQRLCAWVATSEGAQLALERGELCSSSPMIRISVSACARAAGSRAIAAAQRRPCSVSSRPRWQDQPSW